MPRLSAPRQKQLQAIAKSLYLSRDYTTMEDLAEKIGVQARTVTRWAEQGQWDELRKNLLMTRKNQLERLYELLDNETKKEKPNPDGIAKITASIERLESKNNVADTVSVAMDFTEFIRHTDLEKAKEIATLFETYIQSLLKAL